MHQCSALLCAMSVGAAIVIARPEVDEENISVASSMEDLSSTAESTKRSRQSQSSGSYSSETDSEDQTHDQRRKKLKQRIKDHLKSGAVKSIGFGQAVAYKTANATYCAADRIGNSLKSFIDG